MALRPITAAQIRERLLIAGWFLIAYELLKSDVIDRLRRLFVTGFDEKGPLISPRYALEVLSLHKHPFDASLLWLEKNGILDSGDLSAVADIRKHRNDVAHRLPGIVMYQEDLFERDLMQQLLDLIGKLGRHWARTSFPDYPFAPAPSDLADEEVISSTMVLAAFIAQAANLTFDHGPLTAPREAD